MITRACKKCEQWTEKDIIYAVGHTSDISLKSLWLVYGDCYAAESETYERIKNTISTGIEGIPDVEFAETNELGRVNRVDPLGITYLRIRGMWGIDNPSIVYSYVHKMDSNNSFSLAVIMKTEKFNSFPEEDRKRLTDNDDITISDVSIKDPNNPAKLFKSKLITYTLA